jgi:HK97 family phage major capsid protein
MTPVSTADPAALEKRVRDLNAKADKARRGADARANRLSKSKAPVAPFEVSRLSQSYQESDQLRDQAVQLQANLDRIRGSNGNGNANRAATRDTPAERFFRHKRYADYPQISRTPLPIGNGGWAQVLTRPELLGRLQTPGMRLFAVATGDITGGIPLDQQLYPPVPILRRQLRLPNLVTVAATNEESVVYSQQTTRTSAAAETAFGNAYGEGAAAYAKVTTNVQSIGQFVACYREQANDATQFQTVIGGSLSEDVMLRLETQMLVGDGTGSNLKGIHATAGIASVRRNGTASERRIEAVHRAITTVRLAFREPTAILMHPTDAEVMLFEKTGSSADGNFTFLGAAGNAAGDAPATVWGVPLIVSTAATQGTAVVAFWGDATLWIREGAHIRLSDAHSDFFTRRQVAVIGEIRAAFSVERPGTFCECTDL